MPMVKVRGWREHLAGSSTCLGVIGQPEDRAELHAVDRRLGGPRLSLACLAGYRSPALRNGLWLLPGLAHLQDGL